MAKRVDLTIEQGATFTYDITVTDSDGSASDLSTTSAIRLQARTAKSASTTVIDVSLAGGEITRSANVITVTLSATATAAYSFDYAYYDLEIEYSDGTVERLMEGIFTLAREVTR